MMSPRTIRVGVVGFGKSARIFHCPLIACDTSFQLAAVVERHSQESRKLYPSVVQMSSVQDLVSDPSIDLVVVTAPNVHHHELARLALEKSKHVVVEKPFTVTVREAEDLIRLAHAGGRVLSVFHNRRWDGDFLTVRRILESGVLGDLVEYESHFDRFRPTLTEGSWRESDSPGSGILYDLGSHLIDQALTLFGPPISVTAELRAQRPGARATDTFSLVLGYNHMTATLKSSLLAREPSPRFLLHGTRGSFVKRGFDVQEGDLLKGQAPRGEDWGAEPEDQWGLLNTQIGVLHFHGKVETIRGNYPGYYRNLFEAITGASALEVTPEQARDCIRVIELAVESSRKGVAMRYAI